jgi:hypothetical protein
MKYPENWSKISSFFKHQDKDACKKRYLYLQANKGGKWSSHETLLLLNLYQKYGPKWRIISSQIKGRNGDQCKDKMRTIKNKPTIQNSEDPNILRNDSIKDSDYGNIRNHEEEKTDYREDSYNGDHGNNDDEFNRMDSSEQYKKIIDDDDNKEPYFS